AMLGWPGMGHLQAEMVARSRAAGKAGPYAAQAGGPGGGDRLRVLLRDLQARADRAGNLADARSGTVSDRALARSDLQPTAPAFGHRHAEPRRLRGTVLGSPRSGLTQVSTRTGEDQAG